MEEIKKTKKKKSKTRVIIEWVLFGLFLVVFAFAGAAVIDSMIHKKDNYNQSLKFGLGTFIVLTDSMEPEYEQGSAIFTYKDDIKTEGIINTIESSLIENAYKKIFSDEYTPGNFNIDGVNFAYSSSTNSYISIGNIKSYNHLVNE